MVEIIRTVAVVFWLIILSAGDVSAINGNEWKRFPDRIRGAYVMGVVDTWSNVSELSKTDKSYKAGLIEEMLVSNVQCAGDKMTYNQVLAIVEKYMADNPSQWHFAMASIVWTAVAEACAKLK